MLQLPNRRLQTALVLLVAIQMLDWTQSEEPPIKCRFGGAEYDVGERWHPRLETQGTVFCVTCQCYQGGRMNCSSRECPVRCNSREDSSECCRICTESRMSIHRPVSPDVVACIHNGRIYKDGQNFPSNSTGMKVNSPNQCVQCRCQEGLVLCEVQTCQELSCHEPIQSPDNCCPLCSEVAGNRDLSSPVTFKGPTAPRDRRDKDCISAGKYYSDGSSWHPVIGPFGPMDCVMCQCNSGNIECNRFRCPSRAELQCTMPTKQFGQCCPVCPITAISAVQRGDVPEAGSLQCIPKAAELVAYRAQGAGNISEFLQYAFQQPGAKANEAELHSWVVRNGAVHSFQLQTITANNFEDLRHKFRFIPLGTTSAKHVSKFGRREKKLQRRCKTNCSYKVQRLEELLGLNKIAMRKMCLTSELLLTSL
ncbi:chordin-like protein 2 [Cryptotermes secundus]|uniref:chordin-like protein 2 n=1 Tax=Cryptotermes secundus TaxID=105785 RepID=UPI001454CC3C|nr:chordin-like protein 2 [Cryptotermes secundus]